MNNESQHIDEQIEEIDASELHGIAGGATYVVARPGALGAFSIRPTLVRPVLTGTLVRPTRLVSAENVAWQ
jgi:hypothetical protein